MATDRLIMVHENGRVSARGLHMVNGHPQAWHEDNDQMTYTVEWSSWLGSDTIATSTFTDEGNATLTSPANTTTQASVTIKTPEGAIAEITNKVITDGGQTRSLRFFIKARRNDRYQDYGLG